MENKNRLIKFPDSDRLIRATAEGQVMAFAISSKHLVEKARLAHQTTPVATAALGRLLSGGVMMGNMLKNDNDKITIQISGDGPIGGLLVTADTKGNVKGYVNNPDVVVPDRIDGHLNVGMAVGNGSLSVMKDLGLKDSYNGHVPLFSGEIAEDLTHYFLESEQTPSSVGLGVLVNKDGSVLRAGGFILQLLPGARDATIDKIEANLREFGYVTERLSDNDDPGAMLELLLRGLNYEVSLEMPVRFTCDCSRDRVRRAIALLGEVEVASMIKDGKPVELKCQFCNSAYDFTPEDLIEIRKTIENKTLMK